MWHQKFAQFCPTKNPEKVGQNWTNIFDAMRLYQVRLLNKWPLDAITQFWRLVIQIYWKIDILPISSKVSILSLVPLPFSPTSSQGLSLIIINGFILFGSIFRTHSLLSCLIFKVFKRLFFKITFKVCILYYSKFWISCKDPGASVLCIIFGVIPKRGRADIAR